MLNEILLITHSILISFFILVSLKQGKEALIAILCIQTILANLFVTKQAIIFGFCVTCTDAFSIGSTIALNLLQEYFGKEVSKKAIWISFVNLIFYMIMAYIQIEYTPIKDDVSHSYFAALLEFTPRTILASLIAYIISQNIDTKLYSYFIKKLEYKYFIIRNYASILISQFIDTTIFTLLGLYGIVSNLWHILIFSYTIKIIAIIISVSIIGTIKRFIKKNHESI